MVKRGKKRPYFQRTVTTKCDIPPKICNVCPPPGLSQTMSCMQLAKRNMTFAQAVDVLLCLKDNDHPIADEWLIVCGTLNLVVPFSDAHMAREIVTQLFTYYGTTLHASWNIDCLMKETFGLTQVSPGVWNESTFDLDMEMQVYAWNSVRTMQFDADLQTQLMFQNAYGDHISTDGKSCGLLEERPDRLQKLFTHKHLDLLNFRTKLPVYGKMPKQVGIVTSWLIEKNGSIFEETPPILYPCLSDYLDAAKRHVSQNVERGPNQMACAYQIFKDQEKWIFHALWHTAKQNVHFADVLRSTKNAYLFNPQTFKGEDVLMNVRSFLHA